MNSSRTFFLITLTLWLESFCNHVNASTDTIDLKPPYADETISQLPLFTIKNIFYKGAFRIPAENEGVSSANFSSGVITISRNGDTLYLMGHRHGSAIAEYQIPNIIRSTDFNELQVAKILQPYVQTIKRISINNQNLNSVTGMIAMHGGLFFNAVEFYDAPADNTQTSFFIEDSDDLAKSNIKGFFSVEGAAHAAGWISEIPPEWSNYLNGSHIFGFASNVAINTRLSMGPSAFSVNLKNKSTLYKPGKISSIKLIDYDLQHLLHPDLFNEYGKNNLWNEVSTAVYGFIIPGTSTYMVVGTNGSLKSKVGYKITQDNGYECSGPCPYNHLDNYNYYWMYDVFDMLSVLDGRLKPYEVKPYQYGKFDVPFQYNLYHKKNVFNDISGAVYNKIRHELYISINGAGQTGVYDYPPLIAVFGFK